MRRDLQTYRGKLVTSERQAAWSQMARKVAHEVKNPLTPIAISVADLKRSYEQKRPDFPEILDRAVGPSGRKSRRCGAFCKNSRISPGFLLPVSPPAISPRCWTTSPRPTAATLPPD